MPLTWIDGETSRQSGGEERERARKENRKCVVSKSIQHCQTTTENNANDKEMNLNSFADSADLQKNDIFIL